VEITIPEATPLGWGLKKPKKGMADHCSFRGRKRREELSLAVGNN